MCQPHATAASIGPSLLLDLSVAQDPPTKTEATSTRTAPDTEQLNRTIKRQAAEIAQLRRKVTELEKLTQACSLRDRLIKEEQRSEELQRQLLGVGEKEAPLQSRMSEVTDQLRPESLDSLPIAGSLRPEQVRETTRQRLTTEKFRLQSQLDLLQQTRTRLQSSLSTADTLIQRLRAQLQSSPRP
jgi:small-conductance mechanosensitive channel